MAQPEFKVDRTTALYERPAMGVVDVETFGAVKQAVASAFAVGNVEKFLKSVERAGLRIREFEAVAGAGLLGAGAAAQAETIASARPGGLRAATFVNLAAE